MPKLNNYSILLKKASFASIIVSIILILMKLFAWILTNSISIFASLIDSCSDLFASVINFIGINISLIPADDNHHFGHNKAQAITSLLQAIFILSSAIFLFFMSINRIKAPIQIVQNYIGISVILVSIILPLLLTIYQKLIVNQTKSLAIKAESLHYVNDVLLNLSIIVSLYLSKIGYKQVDGILSLLLSILIFFNAIKILKQSFDILMDISISKNDIELIHNIILNTEDVLDYHDLLTRFDGKTYFVQVHIEIDKHKSFIESHEIAKNVIFKIKSQFKTPIEVIVHNDPM